MTIINRSSEIINSRSDEITPAQIRNAAMGKGVNIDHPTSIQIGEDFTNALDEGYF